MLSTLRLQTLRPAQRLCRTVSAMAAKHKEAVHTDKAPAAVGPYSQAVKSKGMLYVSGCIGLDPVTMKLAGDDVEAQCSQVLKNLGAVLAAADCSYADVVKTTILLTSMTDFAAVNALYGACFASDPPARATYAVAGLPLGAKIEIEAIAALRNDD